MAKRRVEIPREIAAKALFFADRTCCVCRDPSKPVQIHHVDDDPGNNDANNLAVLCFDCHRETQISGGFDRKLDADQVRLYRDDWTSVVTTSRRSGGERRVHELTDSNDVEEVTSMAEIHRERDDWVSLALLYSSIGNDVLRDKYIERAIADGIDVQIRAFLQFLQGRPADVSEDVMERLGLLEEEEFWHDRGRLLLYLHRKVEAATDYLRSVLQSLDEGNLFSAAFYLRELIREGLPETLYVEAFREAAQEEDLWWQVRALEDLKWKSELDELVLAAEPTLESRGDLSEGQVWHIRELIARARGAHRDAIHASEEETRAKFSFAGPASLLDDEQGGEEAGETDPTPLADDTA